jgi:membrane fusion protein (multidrug efflux system)
VSIDAMPGKKLVGTVDSFAPASGAQFALLPADNATGNFTKIVQRVPVKIVFQPQDIKAMNGRLVPGMSVIAEVEINQPETQPAQPARHAAAPANAPAANAAR